MVTGHILSMEFLGGLVKLPSEQQLAFGDKWKMTDCEEA